MPLQVGLHLGNLFIKNLGFGVIDLNDLVLGVPVFRQDMYPFDGPIAHFAVDLQTSINGDLAGLLVPFVPFGKKGDGLALFYIHTKDFMSEKSFLRAVTEEEGFKMVGDP